MKFIYLNKLGVPERVRVNPDEIRMIEPMEGVKGSYVTFNNNDEMRYNETPRQIEWKERRVRYLWPNVERLVMLVIGGVIGGILTALSK